MENEDHDSTAGARALDEHMISLTIREREKREHANTDDLSLNSARSTSIRGSITSFYETARNFISRSNSRRVFPDSFTSENERSESDGDVDTAFSTANLDNPVPVGSVIMAYEPFASILNAENFHTHCAYCFVHREDTEDEADIDMCRSCRYVRYCSEGCHRLDYKAGHKYECLWIKDLIKNEQKKPSDAARFMIRIYTRLRSESQPGDFLPDGSFRSFHAMVSHFEEWITDEAKLEPVRICFEECKDLLNMYGKSTSLLPSTFEEFVEDYGRAFVNAYGINDTDNTLVGLGLYIGASVIDHSCEPTAVITNESTTLYVRNIVDLKPPDILKQITVCYVERIQPTLKRIESLRDKYFFTCTCRWCVWLLDDSAMISVGCQYCGHQISLGSDRFCKSCKRIPSDAYIRKCKKVLDKAKRNIASYTCESYSRSVETEENIRTMINQGFSSCHWLLVQQCLVAMDFCITEERYLPALSYGRLALPGLQRYLNTHDPVLGVVLLKLAKLAWLLKYEDHAKKYIILAKDSLVVSYGKESPLYVNIVKPCYDEMVKPESISYVATAAKWISKLRKRGADVKKSPEALVHASDDSSPVVSTTDSGPYSVVSNTTNNTNDEDPASPTPEHDSKKSWCTIQ